MSYVVHGPEWGSNLPSEWSVEHSWALPFDDATVGLGTEAEAHIIAFALNAVAEGRSLWALDRPRNGDIGKNTRYEGTTEGVAPHAN